mmetsp:Transcript_10270/g.18970  ORF Transcript_10270/g.18970 Transcript_10270/m.18970 type:complete len:93 (+) Transcript_10270:743-1021(+)
MVVHNDFRTSIATTCPLATVLTTFLQYHLQNRSNLLDGQMKSIACLNVLHPPLNVRADDDGRGALSLALGRFGREVSQRKQQCREKEEAAVF